jgi:tetraacyldisaccharide 4'-kinase
MRLRRWAYRRQLPGLFSRRPHCDNRTAIICVGNITTGGTGKTPMVAMIVRHLGELGRRPAILTRGYKARGGKSDEAQLLEQLSQGPRRVNVIVNPDRVAGAKVAIGQGADVLVMDDGFAHLRLGRDLNIVLIDALNPFGYGYCLPRGLLREPPSALVDADAIVITHADQASPEDVAALRRKLAALAPRATIHQAAHVPVCVIDAQGREQPPQTLAGKKVFAFCGLGNPESFFETVVRLGPELVGKLALDDHAAYDATTLDSIVRAARACGAEMLLTTQKDFVKLRSLPCNMEIRQLAVRMEITQGRQELLDKIAACL